MCRIPRRSDRRCPASAGSGWSKPTHVRISTGWAGTPTSTSSCCGRCRARQMPTARCGPWCGSPRRSGTAGTNCTARCSRTGRFAAGSSACSVRRYALGDHLVAQPQTWHLLAGNVTLPSAADLRRDFAAVAETPTDASALKASLRKLYRDRVLVLAGLDLAPTVENEPVLAFPDRRCPPVRPRRRRAGRRVDRRDQDGLRRRHARPAAGRHRDGQVRRPRAQLRQRRRRHLRRRARRRGRASASPAS